LGIGKKIVVALGCCGAILPSSSYADWQFARWGMTPSQVVAAGKVLGPIVAAPPNAQGEIEYIGSYRSGIHQFKVKYTFDDGRLSTVSLETLNGCQDLAVEMNSVYGKPISDTDVVVGHVLRWLDRKKSNDVSLLNFGDTCTLIYGKLDTASSSGL
jgi:hypothetical protein